MQITLNVVAGCPPWLPCGKYNNIISGDDEYENAVTSAMTNCGQGATNSPDSASNGDSIASSIDVEQELRETSAALVTAGAEVKRLAERQKSLNPTRSDIIFDQP